jgi:hypothetical protein
MSMPGGGERVVINIEVNSDIATIEATREALERLTRAERAYGRARESRPDAGDDGGDDGGGSSGSGRSRGGSSRGGRGGGGGRRTKPGRYDGFRGEVFDFRGDMGKGIASYGKILQLVNKMSMIELPLLAAAIGGVSLAFKAGQYFIKMYNAAMSTLAGTVGVAFVALTTFLAAQKQFAAVQNSPAYYQGAENTSDRFVAAGQAMSMFVENSNLAVVGAKGLTSAFSKLSANAPITGQTTKAFETLMNVVVGSGGDIEKGTENLATFFNAIQKNGLSGGASAAKELGPDFEKIIKEAGALGIKTKEDFMKAAVEGNLGETFEKKYAGTLDALNNTLMGRFKIAISDIKAQLTDLGGDYLGDAGNAVGRLQGIIQKTIARLAYVVNGWANTGKLNDVIDFIDKGSDKFIYLMQKYLGTAPGIFGFFKSSFDSIGSAFDKMQDWLRTFKEAGDVINRSFFGPVIDGVIEKFDEGFGNVRDLIIENEGAIRGFADQIVNIIGAIGKYGNELRTLIISALPIFTVLGKVIEMFFSGLAKVLSGINAIVGFLKKLGPIGKLLGGAVSVAALYGAIIIAGRFFATLGKMFGKKMNNQMNITAGHVTVTGPGGVPGGHGSSPYRGGVPAGGYRSGNGGFNFMQASGYMTRGQQMQSLGRGFMAPIRGGIGTVRNGLSGVSNLMGGMGNMGLMAGGTALMGLGSAAGGYDTAGGSLLSSAGTGMTALGGARMLMGEEALGKGLARTTKAGKLVTGTAGTALAGVAAIGALSYGAGSYIGGQFNDDSVKSRGTSAAASALAGAGIGAAIGSFVPIIGTGIGAAIGAAIGGVTGYMKAGKQRKETRKAAEALVDDYGSKINDAIEGGNVDDLLAARNQLMVDKQKLINTNADPVYAAKAVAKYDEKFKALNTKITNYTGNAALAEQAFGVSAEALNNLAVAAGIDLSSKVMSFRDILDLVGKSAEDNARLMKLAWSGIGASVSGGILGRIDSDKKAQAASKNIDAAQQKLLSGDTSDAAINSLIEESLNYGIASSGDLGGAAVGTAGLVAEFGVGGVLASLDQAVKDRISARLKEIGATAENTIADIKATPFKGQDGKEITGIQYLGSLIDETTLANKKLLNQDKTINASALEGYLLEMQKKNPYYIAALEQASIMSSMMQNPDDAKAILADAFNTGQVKGVYGTSTIAPSSSDPRLRLPPNQPGAVIGGPNANINITVTGVVDQTAIKQIQAVVAKALVERDERAQTPFGTGIGKAFNP